MGRGENELSMAVEREGSSETKNRRGMCLVDCMLLIKNHEVSLQTITKSRAKFLQGLRSSVTWQIWVGVGVGKRWIVFRD